MGVCYKFEASLDYIMNSWSTLSTYQDPVLKIRPKIIKEKNYDLMSKKMIVTNQYL